MTLLYIGSLLFGGTHLFSILFPGLRDGFKARLGEKPWKGLYALVSLAGPGADGRGLQRLARRPRHGGHAL